ncbi:MAG: M1 family metallopeptidase [Ilumatobacteraceae bacterium]|nr:M1 family metallopeptidase [Ilumatobacteraceae bacterium]
MTIAPETRADLDPYRLPRHVVPRRYEVHLDPNLRTSGFTGRVIIECVVEAPTRLVVLNAKDLEIGAVFVDGAPAIHTIDATDDRLIISTTATVPAGPTMIDITFSGVLNDKLRGFYRSTYRDDDGVEQVIAASQMQSTDCRRAFPCFDEPDFKAVFAVTLACDPDHLAISNGPEVERTTFTDAEGHERSLVRFADTMPMSTYLVAFVVGRLETTSVVDVGGVPLRLVHVPGKSHLTAFGLDVGARSLQWFVDYYGIPYPDAKIDMVALPDFAAGAMENVGCITYRESLLLVDPATSTQSEQQLVADVVSHELAHMWFGDLVTMKWWNGIWLNEAFATFMEVAACAAYRPDWDRWTTFSLDRTAAFDTDSLASTRPIEFEVRSPDDCEGMFDVLTYEKGGAILRMLEQFLGETRFRDGIRHYLRTHSYGNTETSDLWDAIEATVEADGGGEPVRALMDSWIWQPGYPLIGARVEGGELVLRQRRFSFDASNDEDGTWLVPVHVRVNGSTTKHLMTSEELRVPLSDPTAAVVVNAEGHGFYRVDYSPELLARLSHDVVVGMNTVERYNLVDDAWNAVVAGRLSAIDYLTLISDFADERELAVWQAISIGLRGLARVVPESHQEKLKARVRTLVSDAVLDIGWDPRPNEDDLRSKLRGLLVTLLAVNGGDDDARVRCRSILDRSVVDSSDVHPELAAAATSVVASTGDAVDYGRFRDLFRSAATPQEQLRYLYALADFDDANLILETCRFALSGEVKSQNAPFVLARAMQNRRNGDVAWRFVRENWTHANTTFPVNTIIRMVQPVATLNTPEKGAEVGAFFAEHPIPQSAKTLDQVLERQRVNIALRELEESRFAAAL